MFANRKLLMDIYKIILKNKRANKKSFALLIDPDKQDKTQLLTIIEKAEKANTH